MGIQKTCFNAKEIENPERTIPIATLIAFISAMLLYLGSSNLLLGILPAKQLAQSSAPFADAALKMFGPWAAALMAGCVFFKAFSSLVRWTLLLNTRSENTSTPLTLGLSGVIMTVIILGLHVSNLLQEFNEVIGISVLLTILPHLYSATAFLHHPLEFEAQTWQRKAIGLLVALVSLYCIWVITGSEAELVRNAMIILFISIPVYPLFNLSKSTRPN